MELLVPLFVSVFIGWQAQVVKGRTGAAWGAMTFALMLFLYLVMWPTDADMAIHEATRKLVGMWGKAGTAWAIAGIIGGGVMSLIVLTLPKRQQNPNGGLKN